MEILNALGVKPLQIIVQIVGFLLVFGLLSKLLWKPILNLMDEREKEVKGIYDEAEEAKRRSEQLLLDYKDKLNQIDLEAQQRLAEAVKKGNDMAEEIVHTGRRQAELEKEKALNAIKEEAKKARMDLRDFAVTLSIDISKKILSKEIDRNVHEGLINEFLSDLKSAN